MRRKMYGTVDPTGDADQPPPVDPKILWLSYRELVKQVRVRCGGSRGLM